MKVSELRAKVESFRQGMYQYFQLWNRSFDESDDDYPAHNSEELEQQRSSLARQLGALRPYMNTIGLPTDVRWLNQSFDVYHVQCRMTCLFARLSPSSLFFPRLNRLSAGWRG